MKRIYLRLALIFAMVFVMETLSVKPSVAADLFSVNNIDITAKAKNSGIARREATVKGQNEAFDQVLTTLIGRQKELFLQEENKPSDQLISSMVKSVDIRSEKVTPEFYRAKMDISFRPEMMRRWLASHDITIPHQREKPIVIIPVVTVYEELNGQKNISKNAENEWASKDLDQSASLLKKWQNAWKAERSDEALVRMDVLVDSNMDMLFSKERYSSHYDNELGAHASNPQGQLEGLNQVSPTSLSPIEIVTFSDRIDPLLVASGSDKAIVVELFIKGGSGVVKLYNGSDISRPAEQYRLEGALPLDEAVKDVAQRIHLSMEKKWLTSAKRRVEANEVIEVIVPFSSFKQWRGSLEMLESLPSVTTTQILKLSSKDAVVSLKVKNSLEGVNEDLLLHSKQLTLDQGQFFLSDGRASSGRNKEKKHLFDQWW